MNIRKSSFDAWIRMRGQVHKISFGSGFFGSGMALVLEQPLGSARSLIVPGLDIKGAVGGWLLDFKYRSYG